MLIEKNKKQTPYLYYTFHQNKSGGHWKPPAQKVIIQATNVNEACRIGEENGLYFDGEGDCPCCGHRWSVPYEAGSQAPMIYGQLAFDYAAENPDEDVLIIH